MLADPVEDRGCSVPSGGAGDREDQTEDIVVLIHGSLTTQLNAKASCKPFCGLIPACMGQGPDEQQQKQT